MADNAYAQYAHQQPMSTPVREYDIIVRQEPKQARMCGVGGKADRRPIDPPPIVQLRVRDTYLSNPNDPTSPRITHPSSTLNFLQNPYYFMFASLARVDSDDELHLLNDGKTRYTTGSVVSSLYHLKDTENGGEDAGFFVFPDLSVRTEGSYRLKLTLFEVVGSHVQFCKSVYSRPFYVYTAKKFPGMEESTPLSMALSDQGIKIRIRKDVRNRKRALEEAGEEEEEENNEVGGEDGADGNEDYAQTVIVKEKAATTRTRRKAKSMGEQVPNTPITGGKGKGKSAGGGPRPAKRQRTQGGTVIDLSHGYPPGISGPPQAVATSNNANASTSGNVSSDEPAGAGGPGGGMAPGGGNGGGVSGNMGSSSGVTDWSHLPEPSIPGGEPLNVMDHPATRLHPRLKHGVPPNSVSTPPPPPGPVPSGGAGSTSQVSGGGGGSESSSAETVRPEVRTRKSTMGQGSIPPTLPQQQQSSPTRPHHQHTSSSGSGIYIPPPPSAHPSAGTSSWPPSAPPPQTPLMSQPPPTQQVIEYSRSSQATGGGIPLPPLQIPQQRLAGPMSHPQSQPMSMQQQHYTPYGSAASASAGPTGTMASPPLSSASMHHSHAMASAHGHGPSRSQEGGHAYGYGGGGMMMPPMQTHPPSYGMPPPHAPQDGGQPYGMGPPHMGMQGQMGGGYPGHMHSHSMPGPSPSGYGHHGHHLSDPHIHAHALSQPHHRSSEYPPPPQQQQQHSMPVHGHSHSHSGTYDYPPPPPPPQQQQQQQQQQQAQGGYTNTGDYNETSPHMMSMTPISPTRLGPQAGTPLSAHPTHSISLPPPEGLYGYPPPQPPPGRGYSHSRAEGYGHPQEGGWREDE